MDKVALRWGWKDKKVDMWTWRGTEMASPLSQKTGHQTSVVEFEGKVEPLNRGNTHGICTRERKFLLVIHGTNSL